MSLDPHDFADALPNRPRGRGAGLNPANRFQDLRLHVLGEHLDEQRAEHPDGVQLPTEILDDQSRSLINHVDSPDLPFSWTVNPYRGCEHGCIYCYARPGHEYLSLSSGIDFETKILAKRDAPAILRRELSRRSWTGEPLVMSGVTDPYQPIERELGITRACLEVMLEFRQPVSLITKNRLITRDVDLFERFLPWGGVRAAVSLTTLDPVLASKMEPRASSPRDRLEAIRQLSAAGVHVTVMTAPVIPGLNDHEVPSLLEAASAAGAGSAGYVMLRLPHQIKALFLEWLQRHVPGKAAKIESLLRQVRSGELNDPKFKSRMRGVGPIADHISTSFKLFAARHGLDRSPPRLNSAEFRVPSGGGQLDLFGA